MYKFSEEWMHEHPGIILLFSITFFYYFFNKDSHWKLYNDKSILFFCHKEVDFILISDIESRKYLFKKFVKYAVIFHLGISISL